MTEETIPEGQTAAEPAPADASIQLRHTADGIDIEVHAVDNEMNPAIHFAGWIGRNMQALMLLSREDYRAKVEQRRQAERKLAASTPRLVSPHGGPLQ